MLAVFQCVALAVREKGLKGLNEFVPGASYIVDVGQHAYRLWCERRKAAALRDEFAKVAAASAEEARRVAAEVAREVAKDAPEEERWRSNCTSRNSPARCGSRSSAPPTRVAGPYRRTSSSDRSRSPGRSRCGCRSSAPARRCPGGPAGG